MLVEETLTLGQWTSVLKLVTMWQMDRLHGIAIRKIKEIEAEKAEWLDVLDVSALHGLSDVQQLAIQRLSSNSTFKEVEKILIARKYKVASWLEEGYQELVERVECFSDEEDSNLGFKTVSKLYRLRDRCLRSNLRCSAPKVDIDAIRRGFMEELTAMRT